MDHNKDVPEADQPQPPPTRPWKVLTEAQERSYVRADFCMQDIEIDEAARTVETVLVPDPRRYREEIRDGEKVWVDKYFENVLTVEGLRKLGSKMSGMPLSYLPRHIDDAVRYADDRRNALDSELTTGDHIPPAEALERHPALATTPPERSMTFLSIDICGSTALRARIGSVFDQCYQIFFREMANVAAEFSGRILKATGDGLIAYIDTPSINTQCDAAVDMGFTLLRVLNDAINPALAKIGQEPLQMRVGAEHGLAKVNVLSVPSTGFAASDIAANALNRAVKVEKTCAPNTFRIGEALHRRLHVQWLERARLTTADISAAIGVPSYKIYELA